MAPPPLPDGYQLSSPGAAAPNAGSSPGTVPAPPPIPDGYQLTQQPPQDTYGLTDALAHGATFGLSEPVKALGTAAGDWLAGRGFDYSNAINAENAARNAYESGNPKTNFAANVVGGMAAAPGNLAANAVGGATTAAAPSVIRGITANAGIGAGAGAISGAADNANSVTDAATGAGYGALTGGLTGAALGAAGRVIRPNTSPAVQTLRDAGVNLTPGQIAGGVTRWGENLVSGIPGIGSPIAAAKGSTFADFTRGAINMALAPIGENLEAGGAGREAIAEMTNKISKAYDDASSGLGIAAQSPASQQLTNDLTNLSQNAKFMPPDRQQQFQNILQSKIFDRMSPGGGMTPETFQDAKSFLGQQGSTYIHSPDADQRQLGGALLQTQQVLKSALRISNPEAADALGRADAAYAASRRVVAAATKGNGEEPGVFSPSMLQSSIKQQDPTLGRSSFAAGGALMQPYADAGVNVLGKGGPPSVGSGFWHAMGHGAGNAGTNFLLYDIMERTGLPWEKALPIAAIGLGATSGLYSGLGRRAMGGLLAGRPAIAAPIANGLLAATPGAAVASPQAYGGLLSGLPTPQTQY